MMIVVEPLASSEEGQHPIVEGWKDDRTESERRQMTVHAGAALCCRSSGSVTTTVVPPSWGTSTPMRP